MYNIVVRGILLAGGSGSRLYPITQGVSKQLLPIYDKPMIHYSLFTLMAAGIREIRVITTPVDMGNFQRLLDDGSHLGIEISYSTQEKPEGIAQAFFLCEEFIYGHKIGLILGDNIFYGQGLGREFSKYNDVDGAQIFGFPVSNPSEYGVIEIDETGSVSRLIEKPTNSASNLAIPGLYFYDQNALSLSKYLRPSSRGEYEITDFNNLYLQEGKLKVKILPRGTAWFDTGNYKNMHDASSFVRIVEERQGIKVACLEEVAWRQKWIDDKQLLNLAKKYKDNETQRYLMSLIQT